MRDISVVYLDHTAKLSGAEIALARLIAANKRHSTIRSHVVLAEDGPLRPHLEEAGAVVTVVPLDREVARTPRTTGLTGVVRSGAALARYSTVLARTLRSLDCDVVHSFSLKANFYGSLAARWARLPHVWQANDRLSSDYLPALNARAARTVCRVAGGRVVANSYATLETLGRPGTVIYPVLSGASVERCEPDCRESRRTVSIVGRLDRWKGHDVFLRAAARIATSHPDVRFRIIGAALFSGHDEWERHLRQLAEELDIADRVELLGHRDDVPELMANSTVLTHCSTVPEPFGQVVSEGMAAAVPVVATRAGGPCELIVHGESGFLTEPGDDEELAGTVSRLLDDPDLRRRIGRNGRERIQDLLDPATLTAKLVEVYEDARNDRS